VVSAIHKTKNINMSEPETSGAPTASAETTNPPAAFGTSRGSGLARGKRPAAPAAATAPASNGEYRPTAIEVVTPKSDYQNPFAESAPAAPAKEEPKPAAVAPAPVNVETKPTPSIAATPATVESEIKPQLNILPPEEPKRPSLSWENSPAGSSAETPARPDARPRRDERPIFRAERPEQKPPESHDPRDFRREPRPFESRESKPFESRQPRPFDPRDSREPRHEHREQKPFEPREPRDSRREVPFEQRDARPKPVTGTTPKKSGGFFGWLKNLFGGTKPAETNGNGASTPDSGHGRDDQHRNQRRRHRGGRGRGGYRDGNAPRGEGQPRHEGGHDQNGEHRQHDGGYRRRRRGGRGRNFRPGDQQRGQGGPPSS
jgi:hypothetical protein